MHRLALPAALLALAACSGGDDVSLTNASANEVAEATRDMVRMEPGLWKIDMEVVEMDIPGMPPEVRQSMKGAMGGVRQIEHCLTEAEANRPPAALFAGQNNNECRYERFTMDGGRIDGTLRCNPPAGGSDAVIRMAGNYTPTAYEVDVRVTGEQDGQDVTIHTRGRGARAGACTEQPET